MCWISPGSTPALFMRIKSAFWYSKCAFNAHKKRWCATWVGAYFADQWRPSAGSFSSSQISTPSSVGGLKRSITPFYAINTTNINRTWHESAPLKLTRWWREDKSHKGERGDEEGSVLKMTSVILSMFAPKMDRTVVDKLMYTWTTIYFSQADPHVNAIPVDNPSRVLPIILEEW